MVKAYYDSAVAATYSKRDGSPVTDADIAADRAIREVLARRPPDEPILTEEGQDNATRLDCTRCWIVDPIDGTEQFILRTGEFDVLVALVEYGRPIVAAGYQPTTGTLVTATRGSGTWLRTGDAPARQIRFEPTSGHPRLATSKWFGAPENAQILEVLSAELSASRAQSMMTGFTPRLFLPPRPFDAMVGVRHGEDQFMAWEWDFAVADLVISEAGGKVTDLEGHAFQYNKADPRNTGGLIAAADPETHGLVVDALRNARATR